jgi:hypothetical protein
LQYFFTRIQVSYPIEYQAYSTQRSLAPLLLDDAEQSRESDFQH